MTPFLIAVTRALSAELEVGFNQFAMKKQILNEIIRNIPPEISTPTAIIPSAHTIDTLHLEFDGILRRYSSNESKTLTYFRSFQHVDNFKQTSFMMSTFDALNSNLSDMCRTQGKIFYFLITSSSLSKDQKIICFRVDLPLLGVFLRFNDTSILFDSYQKVVRSEKNRR